MSVSFNCFSNFILNKYYFMFYIFLYLPFSISFYIFLDQSLCPILCSYYMMLIISIFAPNSMSKNTHKSQDVAARTHSVYTAFYLTTNVKRSELASLCETKIINRHQKSLIWFDKNICFLKEFEWIQKKKFSHIFFL